MEDGGEFEIEVADLRTGQTIRSQLAGKNIPPNPPPTSTTPLPPPTADASLDEITVERLRLDDGDRAPAYLPRWLRSPRASRLSPASPASPARVRRLRGLLAGAGMLVVFGTLLLSLPATRQGISILLRPATPTVTEPVPIGANLVRVTLFVPWGTLHVEGQVVGISGFRPLPVVLGRGRHQLDYQADPFPPRSCLFTVPAAVSDTCPPARDVGTDPSLGAAR